MDQLPGKIEQQFLQFNEVEICYKRKASGPFITLSSSIDTEKLLREVYPFGQLDYKEFFYVVLLNKLNEVLGVSKVGEGSSSSVSVNIVEIFQLALKLNAHGIILSHNHPAGNTKVSHSDISITKKVKQFASLIEVKLIDHVILTSESYVSFADEGLLD